jgi:hypothetical protein
VLLIDETADAEIVTDERAEEADAELTEESHGVVGKQQHSMSSSSSVSADASGWVVDTMEAVILTGPAGGRMSRDLATVRRACVHPFCIAAATLSDEDAA